MRSDTRTDSQGQEWHFVIEDDQSDNVCWVYKRPHLADRAEFYLAEEIWDWLEQQFTRGDFVAYPSMCAIAFKVKSHAMLFKLTWDNMGPYKKAPF